MVIQLRQIEENSIKEIASTLEIEQNYVRVLLSRARNQIANDLKQIYYE